MKKKLMFWVFIYISNVVLGQAFYEVKYTVKNINYTAFIEFFEKDNIKVRVKFTDRDGKYKVAKFRCRGKYWVDNDGEEFYLFDGYNASLVYPKIVSNGYFADNFLFRNTDGISGFETLYTYGNSDLRDGKIDYLIKAKYKILNPKIDFTKKYIYDFFNRNEPEYIKYTNLISNNSSNYITSSYTTNTSSSSSTSSSSTSNYLKLKFKNNCHEEIKTLIRFKNTNGKWQTKGWWKIKPGKTAYLEDTKNRIFYFYAKSTESSTKWGGKDNFKTFNGKRYGFRKKSTSKNFGDWITNITCNDSSGGSSITSNIKIHLIFAADIEDPSIGHSTKEDMNDITSLFKKAAKELNVKFKSYKLYGNYFDKKSINSTVANLSVKNNDVVIFYYSGHGYNNTNSYNKFPNMSLDGPDLRLESIHKKLKYKGARLTLTIGDLCNSIPRMRSRTAGQTEIPFKSGFLFDNRKLKKLFIDTKGDLISTSSKKGQWSYTMGNDSNGHFTNAFINAFTKEASKVSNYRGSWTSLFSNAYKEVKHKTRGNKNQDGSYGQTGTNTNNLKY